MMDRVTSHDVFGFVRPDVDAHTLGIQQAARLLRACGLRVVTADEQVSRAVGRLALRQNIAILEHWLEAHHITRLGYSYRLDPEEGASLFGEFFGVLEQRRVVGWKGGPVKTVYFAGLPGTCEIVHRQHGPRVRVFPGSETPREALRKFGVDAGSIPASVAPVSEYDENRLAFAKRLVASYDFERVRPVARSGVTNYGSRKELLTDRLQHSIDNRLPPLLRAHVGPYRQDRAEALAEFATWLRLLAEGGMLDIVSIGSSQLTQSHFGRDWGDAPNGGGVPINSAQDYADAWQASRPMLVRAYAGTSSIVHHAGVQEEYLNTAWHALSLWWFSKIDGRGPNSVLANLQEHAATLDYVAATGKPFEPNVPHQFAFRGSDDVTYVASAYLAAKFAKQRGVTCLILQNMLNTPRDTTGVQDLAKSRAMLRLVRSLEDDSFRVVLQPRAGLAHFSSDSKLAQIQLAAATAMMDDIEPDDLRSPGIIHVVSYSESSRIADPEVIDLSLRITRSALEEYRREKLNHGGMMGQGTTEDIEEREAQLHREARTVIEVVESEVVDCYSPEGLYRVLAAGFLPVPELWECREEFRYAVGWSTAMMDGGVNVIDSECRVVPAAERVHMAVANLRRLGTSGRGSQPADP